MAKKQPIKDHLHAVEEKHRGKWQQLMAEDDKPKYVRVTEQTAEAMNVDKEKQGIRYRKLSADEAKDAQKVINSRAGVEDEEEAEKPSDEQKAQYKELYGRKPFNGWSAAEVEEKIKEAKADKK